MDSRNGHFGLSCPDGMVVALRRLSLNDVYTMAVGGFVNFHRGRDPVEKKQHARDMPVIGLDYFGVLPAWGR